ncbi:MAG TPA: preprotein translocase subunit YajC [Spirochaetota bacterium]|nr:preprotein translocase subunit YajC [Spirochaetota bacterium]
MFGTAAYAQAQGSSGAAGGGMGTILLLVVTFAIFYFLLIRPQQKKEKERLAMVNSIQKGDKVLTSGGMYGVVQSVNNDVVVLKVGTNTNIEFVKGAIQAKVS